MRAGHRKIFPKFQKDLELVIHGHLYVLQNRRCQATSITARPMRQNSDEWILSYDTVAADLAPAGSAAGEAAGVDKLRMSEKQIQKCIHARLTLKMYLILQSHRM